MEALRGEHLLGDVEDLVAAERAALLPALVAQTPSAHPRPNPLRIVNHGIAAARALTWTVHSPGMKEGPP
ncbi:hypothetical protein GCM10022221_72690 [Actinocorallia aurea]